MVMANRKPYELSGYKVNCEDCGISELTNLQYDKQMKQADKPWRCPNCGMYPVDFIERDNNGR
jgi:rubredoxin